MGVRLSPWVPTASVVQRIECSPAKAVMLVRFQPGAPRGWSMSRLSGLISRQSPGATPGLATKDPKAGRGFHTPGGGASSALPATSFRRRLTARAAVFGTAYAGSNPAAGTTCGRRILVSASVLQADRGEFDSLRPYHAALAKPAKATALKAVILSVRLRGAAPTLGTGRATGTL